MNGKELFGFLKFLKKDHILIGHVRENNDINTKIINNLEGLELSNEIPLRSFKNFLLPQKENLLNKKKGAKQKMAFAGLGIIDLKAITILNQVFEKDQNYQERIKNSLLIGYSQFPCEYNGPVAGRYEEEFLEHLQFDIFFVEDREGKNIDRNFSSRQNLSALDPAAKVAKSNLKVGRNWENLGYRILTGSEKGQKVLDNYGIGDYDHVQFSGPIKEEGVEQRMVKIREAMENQTPQSKIFLDLGKKCIECGRCSLICPLCYCFCVKDEPSETGKISRIKTSTTCFYSEFSEVAGGHKFLKNPCERIFNWYEHKFVRLPQELSLMGCVGCGRCSKVCPVGIHLKDVLGELMNEN